MQPGMRILHITDRYGWESYGTKRSLYEELARRVDVTPQIDHELPVGRCGYLSCGYTHVFYASTGCGPSKKERAIKVGFGFSDPLHLNITMNHWREFDHYFSLSPAVIEAARRDGIDAHPFAPAVAAHRYGPHQSDHRAATTDAIMLGRIAGHPSGELRARLVSHLRDGGLSVATPSGLSRESLLEAISRARIGLNALGPAGALSRSVFEYAACGLCIVSTPDSRVAEVFTPGKECLFTDMPDLLEQLRDVERCRQVAAAGRARLLRDHTMKRRVDQILEVLQYFG